MWSVLLGFAIALIAYWAYKGDWWIELLSILAMIFGLVSCNQSDWYQSYERQRDAELKEKDRQEATPRVVREADGCKVYTFKAGGHWHYFTRCQNNTSTEANRSYSCGTPKAPKTCHAQEIISTENK